MEYSQPGKCQQTEPFERFNRTSSYRCLKKYFFDNFTEARDFAAGAILGHTTSRHRLRWAHPTSASKIGSWLPPRNVGLYAPPKPGVIRDASSLDRFFRWPPGCQVSCAEWGRSSAERL